VKCHILPISAEDTVTVEEEIRALRQALEPIMLASGRSVAGLRDDQFAGRLRRLLMAITGGANAAGFAYSAIMTVAGDYQVTLEWSAEAMEIAPKSERIFTGYGDTETLAFFYAARNALQHAEYRDMPLIRVGYTRL
jgi:hypothetical protein